MSFTIKGHLLQEQNPMFLDPTQSLGSNKIEYIILTCFNSDETEKFRKMLHENNSLPIQYRFSYPLWVKCEPFQILVKCKIRQPKPDSLLRLIDWEDPILRKTPLPDWIGKEFAITVAKLKYDIKNKLTQTDEGELTTGGSQIHNKGYYFHIKSICSSK